jgi:hypothetical protein
VSEYVAKKTKSKKKQKIEERRKRAKEARDGIKELMRQLEKVGLNWVADCDLSVQNKLREVDCLGDVLINGYKGRFSQMAIATGYWSPLHTDDDVFRTLLSCYCKKKMNTKKKDDILFYFVFPSVGIAIPMRSTDILVFDSKIQNSHIVLLTTVVMTPLSFHASPAQRQPMLIWLTMHLYIQLSLALTMQKKRK